MLVQNLVQLPAKQQDKASTVLLGKEEQVKLISPQMTFFLSRSGHPALHIHVSFYIFAFEEVLRYSWNWFKNSVATCLQWNLMELRKVLFSWYLSVRTQLLCCGGLQQPREI